MLNEFLVMILAATGFAVCLMVLIWLVARRFNNLGVVDVAWSISFMPLSIFFALMGQGDPLRRWLMAGMAGVWSLRLGLHIAVRVMSHHPWEDVRYSRLRADWGAKVNSKTFWFFQLQAVMIILLSTVFLVPCLDTRTGISPTAWAGVAVWLLALLGESLADLQLKHFRANPANQGRICQDGLWYYSRHPNYFFEWLVWVGFFLFAWGSPGGCFTVLCPALMLFFLLRVTGIPLTEELSVQSKGEAYREYQRTTSAFVPWLKKRAAAGSPKIN
jgi:steroid 5-alpha reductase family enzyme